MLLDANASTDSNIGLSKIVRDDGREVSAAPVLLCVKHLRDCASSSTQDTPNLIGDLQHRFLLNGMVRVISGTVGVGTNAAGGRTAVYSAFVICGLLAQKTGSEEVLARSLGGRFGQLYVSGTEGRHFAACEVALTALTPAFQYAAITVVSFKTSLNPVRAIQRWELNIVSSSTLS